MSSGRNPIALVNALSEGSLPSWPEEAIEDLLTLDRQLTAAVESTETWYTGEENSIQGPVAYFSAEYGLHETLPIYSGGLGVLAGDHLKSTSDLGIPLVAIGLLYRNGYVRQHVDASGNQLAHYPEYDFGELAVVPANDANGAPLQVNVPILGEDCVCKVWKVQVGRVSLYLLDTDIAANPESLRGVTQRLYGGGTDTRIKQEIVLGIGGVRALEKLDIKPSIFHLNEGHSSFLSLERLRKAITEDGVEYDDALTEIRRTSLFTTHTPVEAGHDRFSADLFTSHMSWLSEPLGLSEQELLGLGRWPDNQDPNAEFNMTLCALHTADQVNGVAALHGEVSRQMFARYWPDRPDEETPIAHVTNGVHRPMWQDVRLWGLIGECDCDQPESYQARVDALGDYSLWHARNNARAELTEFIARRNDTRADRLQIQAPPKLNPEALTIGFARRFATYKRADLLFSDIDRLVHVLDSAPGPVQFVFAGKAHPADNPGQAVLRRVYESSLDPRLTGRVMLMEDYDMEMGRHLTRGVDVWLNTPRRPKEASGTSGMKAAMNGGLNLSILDGWWPEGYDGTNGWVIGDEYKRPDGEQDAFDLNALMYVLENYVFPLFYDRNEDGIPSGWVRMMRAAISSVTPVFNSDRQVGDYYRSHYSALAAPGEPKA